MSMKKLCCIFNYAPLYRSSIFKQIDEYFDTQFYFGDMKSDIKKIDYSFFKKYPIIVHDMFILGKILWRRRILSLPFKDYDCFLLTGEFSLSYFPLILICKLKKKKILAWGHGAKHFEGKLSLLSKWMYNNCDKYLTYGEGGKKRLVDLGISPLKLDVIYNSLNDGVINQNNNILKCDLLIRHFGNNHPTIFFIGRLTKVKQIDWILKALLVHKQKYNLYYNFLIVGEGSEHKDLEAFVKSNNISDVVWFYGKCYNNDELGHLIYNSDLCVSPGNVGLTALHSMIYGTPVLSNDDFETQMPEYETIIPGKTGDLYHKGDFNDFCEKIKSWITKQHDRELIRQNCYQMINDKWNSNYQIQLLKKIIDSE